MYKQDFMGMFHLHDETGARGKRILCRRVKTHEKTPYGDAQRHIRRIRYPTFPGVKILVALINIHETTPKIGERKIHDQPRNDFL